MPPRFCCCPGCDVMEDDFNRSDSTSLGSKWVEVSGDAEIDSNQLVVVTEGNIIEAARQQYPRNPSAPYCTRIFIDLIEGESEYSIVCGFEDDDNYDWIRITEDGSTGQWYPEFLRTTSGFESTIMDRTTHPQGGPFAFSSGVMELDICYAPVEWSAQAGTQTKWQICDEGGKASLPADTSVGLVGVRNGRFDNINYDVHWESDFSCDPCNCFCLLSTPNDYLCLPEEMTLTLVPDGDPFCFDPGTGEECCGDPENLTATLYQRVPDTSGGTPGFGSSRKTPNKFQWYSELIIGEDGSTPVPDDLWAVLICDLDYNRIWLGFLCYPDIYNFAVPGSTHCGGGAGMYDSGDVIPGEFNAAYFIQAESTCDPLSLVFPPIFFSRSAFCQCATQTSGTCGALTYGVNGERYIPVVTA